MANADAALLRTFSSIDDSLNLLLDDLKQEDGLALPGSAGGQGLTPLPGQWSLGADALVTASIGSGSAAAHKGTAAAAAAATQQLAAAPQQLAPGFVPVPLPAKLRLPGSGGKVQLGGGGMGGLDEGSPSLQLHPSGGGSFAIHAFGRPLTQLDFISTDDLDDEQQPAGTKPRGEPAPAASDALFGGLGQSSHMGSGLPLASMEDLRRMAFDPSPLTSQLPDAMGLGDGGSSGGAYLGSSAAFMHLSGPGRHGFLPTAPAAPHTFFPAASEAPFGSYGSSAPAGEGMPHPLLRPALLRVRAAELPLGGSGEYSGGVRATSLSPVTGNLKRRLDGLGLGESDAEGSPRGMKRHSSSSLWSEGSADNGSDTPRSSTPRGGQSGFVLNSSGSGPSRFAQEPGSMHRRPSGSSDDDDPAYTPSRSRQHRPAAPRQQQQGQQRQQQQQGWHVPPQALPAYQHFQQAALVAATAEAEAEQAPARQQYRGVSRHRLTQRWEASLWLNGRQLYLGGFNSQEDAARAYDLAALACKGQEAQINFSPAEYADQLREIEGYTRDEVVAYVRRRSSAFSRGKSRFRGVSGHNGRWEARIGSFGGRKNVSFGVFETEEDAARQYDRALILEKGRAAKTNFPMRDYEREVSEYEAHLVAMCGTAFGPATHAIASELTLPRHREATADEKKRSAVIYAESLRCALAALAPMPLPRAGRR